MNERIGRWLAVGDVAEIFEWGSRVVKLYKSTAAKPAAFRKVAIQAAVEASGLPVPPPGARKHRNCCLKVQVRLSQSREEAPFGCAPANPHPNAARTLPAPSTRRNGREPRRLGTGLTRAGYVAATVDHLGNDTIDG
jgi:hypothetical protein